MNKLALKTFIFILATCYSALCQTRNTIYVSGRDIFSACGEKLVLRGVNEMMIWSNNHTGSTILPEIAKTGANAVRLAWSASGSVSELDQLIGNCINNKMIAIPELHDATGNFSNLQKCLDYWKRSDVAAVIQKHEKWVIVNIANEVGNGSVSDSQYENYYKSAIAQLRTAGYEVPLLIDAASWGNEEHYVVNSGVALLASDPKKNIIFSVHTYWGGSNQKTRLDKLVNDMKAKNLPWMVAEGPQKAATPQSCNALFPYIYLLDKFQSEGIGWLSWSWGAVDNGDCGAPNSVFDMTTNGKFTGLNSYGQEICIIAKNSIKNTSVRPASISGSCTVSGIEDITTDQSILKLTVYPNPTEGNFTIEGRLNGNWILYNILGNPVMEGTTNNVAINSLSSGVYSLQANGQNIRIVKN